MFISVVVSVVIFLPLIFCPIHLTAAGNKAILCTFPIHVFFYTKGDNYVSSSPKGLTIVICLTHVFRKKKAGLVVMVGFPTGSFEPTDHSASSMHRVSNAEKN